MLNQDHKDAIKQELASFAQSLHLSDDQKTRLKSALEDAREKIEMARKANPGITADQVKAKLKDAKGPLREKLVNFLTPEQLTKWDAEVTKAKTFLGVTSH
jgi:predicted  nucleic acid-binding Zn-ribbon protein